MNKVRTKLWNSYFADKNMNIKSAVTVGPSRYEFQ